MQGMSAKRAATPGAAGGRAAVDAPALERSLSSLAPVLEKCMMVTLGDLWTEVVQRDPPSSSWGPHDCAFLLHAHFDSVFRDFLPSGSRAAVDDVRQTLQRYELGTATPTDVARSASFMRGLLSGLEAALTKRGLLRESVLVRMAAVNLKDPGLDRSQGL